jgi:hypothetical protein
MDDGRPTENALLSFPLGNAMGRSQADALADSKAVPGSEASEDLWATWSLRLRTQWFRETEAGTSGTEAVAGRDGFDGV